MTSLMPSTPHDQSGSNFHRRSAYVVLFSIAAIVSASAAAVIYAPYLPRLLTERYPQPQWPSPGSFAVVKGAKAQRIKLDESTKDLPVDAMGRRLFEEKDGKALLIFQDGKLKLERYAAGVKPSDRFNSYSLVKSLVGVLVLRAHAEERIKNLEDSIGAYLPELGNAEFPEIPILSILKMRSGVIFEANAAKSAVGQDPKDIEAMRLNPFGPMARLHMLGLEEIAGKLRTRSTDRGRYKYQNINTSILGGLLESIYGEPLESILSAKIWQPAGARSAHWRRHGDNLPVTAYCCLYATPRDWVQIGKFLINNGEKDGPFLPDKLWKRFLGLDLTYRQIQNGRYGLHLYRNVLDRAGERLQGPFSYMFGSRGQVVYLMPERNLVVVRFGQQIQLLHSTLYSAWNTVHPK